MRFAGQTFNKFSEQKDFSDADNYMRRIQGVERTIPQIQNPVVPGFNTEDLTPTPELPAGTPFNQNEKKRYIQQVPGSGISSVQNGTEVANLFNPLNWFNNKNQSDIDKMRSGSEEKIDQKGIKGVIMNRNRELNRLMNELE